MARFIWRSLVVGSDLADCGEDLWIDVPKVSWRLVAGLLVIVAPHRMTVHIQIVRSVVVPQVDAVLVRPTGVHDLPLRIHKRAAIGSDVVRIKQTVKPHVSV